MFLLATISKADMMRGVVRKYITENPGRINAVAIVYRPKTKGVLTNPIRILEKAGTFIN